MGIKGIVAGAGLLAMTAGVFLAPQASATAPPPKLWVSPAKVTPGQALEFTASCYGTRTAVTSPGLAGPVALQVQPGSGTQAPYIGHGKAAGKTGTGRQRGRRASSRRVSIATAGRTSRRRAGRRPSSSRSSACPRRRRPPRRRPAPSRRRVPAHRPAAARGPWSRPR